MTNPFSNSSRWFIAFIVVLGLHIGLAITLMAFWNPMPPSISNIMPATAIMLEFSPFAEALSNNPDEQGVVDQQLAAPAELEPEPELQEELPIPEPEVVEAPKPKIVIPPKKEIPKPKPKPVVKPVEKPLEKPKESVKDADSNGSGTTTSSAGGTGQLSNRSAGPVTGTPSAGVSRGQVTWQGRILGHLARYKRYPREATRRNHEGIVKVSFAINAQGQVLNPKIVNSSGSSYLDSEVLAMLKRAAPLPKPPAEVLKGNSSISIVVPIDFNFKRDRRR